MMQAGVGAGAGGEDGATALGRMEEGRGRDQPAAAIACPLLEPRQNDRSRRRRRPTPFTANFQRVMFTYVWVEVDNFSRE